MQDWRKNPMRGLASYGKPLKRLEWLLDWPQTTRLKRGVNESQIFRIQVSIPALKLVEDYAALHEFACGYDFKPETEDYLVHITTGSHVQQICLFLLTESRHFPARLIQTSPADPKRRGPEGKFAIIDLDLSKYDRLAARFGKEQKEARSFLKSGIATRSKQFNQLIEQIEHVAIHAKEPILLTGPTGAGKSQLAPASTS